MLGILEMFGVFGIILVLIIVILLPLILTIIVGVGFANLIGFEGIYWWAFVILFYLLISSLFGALSV